MQIQTMSLAPLFKPTKSWKLVKYGLDEVELKRRCTLGLLLDNNEQSQILKVIYLLLDSRIVWSM